MARVNSTGKESSSNFSPANGTGSAVRTAMKDIFESIRTFNSASGDPSGTANLAAFQPHIDSDTNLLKIRNAANSAFITLGNVSEANFGHLDLSGGTLTGVLGLPNATASAPAAKAMEKKETVSKFSIVNLFCTDSSKPSKFLQNLSSAAARSPYAPPI